MKKFILLSFSVIVTGILIYYLLTRSLWTEWQRIFINLNPSYMSWYLLLYGGGLFLRTFRYSLLLKSVKTMVLPSLWQLTLVTSVRNMLVDFFPARTGSLSYIILLNKAYRVDLSPCLSSFTSAFLFDQLALAPLLAVAILFESLNSNKNYFWLWVLAMAILMATLILILFISPMIRLLFKWISRIERRGQKFSWLKKMEYQVQELSQSFSNLKQASIFWPILGLSILVRAFKYLSLYLLLSAVILALTGQRIPLPFWMVLLGLAASEASAGLPISGIAGFGLYEGVLGSVLASQGIHPSQAVLISFAMHFITQIVDYSLGGGALIYILIRWSSMKKNRVLPL